jgi:hypothetical protein
MRVDSAFSEDGGLEMAEIVAKGHARRNDGHLIGAADRQPELAGTRREDFRRSAKTSVRAALVMAATAACFRRRSTEMA